MSFQFRATNFLHSPRALSPLTLHAPVAAMLLWITAPSALAQTHTWTGGAGTTDWHNPMNWSPMSVPTAASQVLIPAGLGQARSRLFHSNFMYRVHSVLLPT